MPKRKKHRMIDVNGIPTLPAIAIEALRLMEGEPSSFKSIADLLKNDQVLASRVLHYASSVQTAGREVSSISKAISLLGFNAVRGIILSASIFDCFSAQFKRQKQGLVNFWLHSIGVAAAAELLAPRLGFASPDQAYIAGLIHDLGKLVCFIQFPEEFEAVCQEMDRQGTYSIKGALPLEIEEAVLGTTHIAVGKLLAEQWAFPDPLGRVMWLHHQPIFDIINPDESALPSLTRFADVLCVTHNVGASYFLASEPHCHEHFHFALENIALHHHFTPRDIDEIMGAVHDRLRSVGDILGFWDEEVYWRLIRSANVSLGSISMNLEKQNRELAATNRVLRATGEMTRALKTDLPLSTLAGVIADAARQAFGIKRCLCMILDREAGFFVGQIFDDESQVEIKLPSRPGELRSIPREAVSEIEAEALNCLEKTNLGASKDFTLESGMMKILAGSKFLAAFFPSSSRSNRQKYPIIGELVADFSSCPDFADNGMEALIRNFEALAMAAGNVIEPVLLEKDLERQTHELAEAARKMEESQRQLFHSHRLATVGRLAAGAAHEINNPLTIISLNTQLLARLLKTDQDAVTPQVADRLKIISEQEERISKIIQELMGFARPSQPKFGRASIADIMNKVLAVIGDRVSMAGIEIDNHITGDDLLVIVDSMQIEQVFMNLLINANHAMSNGGKLTITAEAVNGFIEVGITDTGEGITPENLGKIFDPFFTTKKEGEGTGLGLAICHSIVEHNGGFLRVKSRVGEGSTFTVSLPMDKGSRLRAMKEALEEKKAAAPTAKPEKYRILVVDDERNINDVLQENLRAAGYEADGAYDGVEGIGLLRYKKYHMVLLDIRMPRKDGLEVLQYIKDEFPDIKIIIITGLASVEEIKETVRMGAFACLKKPFRLEKVLETVERAFNSSRES